QAYIQEHPLEAGAETLVLDGDILPLGTLGDYDWFFDRLSQDFEQVYWIAGNHDYYRGDIGPRSGTFTEKIRDNVTLVNNQMVEVDGVGLILTTLWSRLSAENQVY